MYGKKFLPRGHIALPVLGEPLKMYEHHRDASRSEERHGVLEMYLSKWVSKNALIHEVRVPFNFEQQPAQVMQFERRKNVRGLGHRFLNRFAVLANGCFQPGLTFARIEKP